jgi:DNA-binding GntR family transcriptional regulator
VLVGVVGRLFDARLGPLFDQLHSHFETPEVWAQAIAEHREVLKALRSKDPVQARAAIQKHMDVAYRRLTSSLTRAPKKAAAAVRSTKRASISTASTAKARSNATRKKGA